MKLLISFVSIMVLSGQITFSSEFFSVNVLPPVDEHVHGATIVECPNGDMLAAWFQGSGERWADDVRIMGARLPKNHDSWSDPFVMADTPEFPDINPVLFFDPQQRLWLVWYTVIANQWETSLLKYRISDNYEKAGAPHWSWQDVIHVKPGDKTERGIQPGDRFVVSVEKQIKAYRDYLVNEQGASEVFMQRVDVAVDDILRKARGEDWLARGIMYKENGEQVSQQMGYPYFRRMGWQTKNKPFITQTGRIILPLYSDGFSFSLMAMTDDLGATWSFSEPLVGGGNIQASIAEKKNGTLVAFMRDNGPPPQRLHTCFSTDAGDTWSLVRDSEIANSGAGSDVVTLANGHWLLANNDLEEGRHSLAIYRSTDEGESWPDIRHLERDDRKENRTRFAYPSIIQGQDGSVHVIYSVHFRDGRGETIRYARFDETWVAGDTFENEP
jgi:predicted neuraminidase